MVSEFAKGVLRIVRAIPYGRVMSYGQVAAYVEVPRGARQVGGVLRTHDEENVPWWRVINNAGHISIKNMFHAPSEQRGLLEGEGIEVSDEYTVDIEKYRFVPNEELLRGWGLTGDYLDMIRGRFRVGY